MFEVKVRMYGPRFTICQSLKRLVNIHGHSETWSVKTLYLLCFVFQNNDLISFLYGYDY